MWYHTAISMTLLVIPMAITVGIYIGVEYEKVVNYPVYPVFPGTGGIVGGGGSGSGSGIGIQTQQFCQKSYGITPFPGQYVFNPNQWGDTNNDGTLCMNITTDSRTIGKTTNAAQFTATWQYPQGPASEPVHAFPNAKLELAQLPIALNNMAELNIDVDWHYKLGMDNYTGPLDNAAMDAANVNCNVCVDMFLASDKSKADSTTLSGYEVMVWIGRWGPSTQPIGYVQGSQMQRTINGTTFELYYGSNQINQKVFTWVADGNITTFAGNIAPLVNSLSKVTGPQMTEYLGYIAFGSEALWSAQNITFSVPRLNMGVTQGAAVAS